jgi:phage gp46-like protein
MLQDFMAEQQIDSTFDIVIDEDNKIYDFVEGFETAINFQLFVDKRTSKQDVNRPRDRQGWMGDILTKQEGYEVGSLVYLKNQSRNTQIDKNELAGFARNAVGYLVQIGAAKNVTAEVAGDNIEGTIEIDNNNIQQYSSLWRDTVTVG